MIRSALETILSKLLYKYVENLHVNDLLYPSMCGFVTGAVSGYASNKSSPSIHVKHVKLRNGTIIYNTAAAASQEAETANCVGGGIVLKLGEGGFIGSLKVGMEGSDYSITVEDAVIVLELVVDEGDPDGIDQQNKGDKRSNMKNSSKETAKSNNVENTSSRNLSESNAGGASDDKSSSASDGGTAAPSTTSSFLETIDSLSRTLAALPRIKIINCLVNLNIILMTPTATERVEQQCALVQIGVGTFTISLPELFENETEIAAQDASKTQPMVARHFKLADGGFWIKIRKDENVAPSIIQTEKSPAASRPFFHRADSNSSFTKNSTLNNSSSSVWACDRWAAATAATSSYSHAASLLLPMTMLFKCPSLQMSTKWEYEMFRTINGTIEEYIYEHTIDYPMLFDYQSIQQPSNAREGGHIDRHHEELHSNGLMIKISLTKHIEFNVDKDILDVIGLLIAVASGFSKKKKDEGNDLVVVRQTSSRRLLLGDYEDKRDPTLISLDRKPGRSLNCTFELHVSKIILRVQQRPLADMSSRLSSHHSFSFWYFNIISISYRLNLRFESSSEKEVVVTMDGTARKIALHKFVAAQPKQVLLSFESISGNDSSHILNQSYDPWDSKSSGSIRHNNTIEAAVHVFLWFEIPSASAISSSAENSNTTMHLSVLVGSVTATLSPVFLQELSETVIDAQRRLFELKQVEHHEEAHRQHYDTVLKKKSDQVVAGASSSERRTREIKLDRKELIIINYDVKIGNACILWDEKIQLKLECASIRGCKTHPDDENFQFFLKSLLDCITIEINRRPQRRESFLSLGSLPDGVRMLILLFVGDDTTALEQVLNIPPDTNRLMLMINLNQRLSLV